MTATLFQGGSAVGTGPGLGNELSLVNNGDILQATNSGTTRAISYTAIPILGRNRFQHSWVMTLDMPASGTTFNVRASYAGLNVEPGARGIVVANNGAGTLQILMNRTNFTYTITAGRNLFLPLFMAPEMIDLTFTDTSGFANTSAMLTSEEMVPSSI
jgi:hypothetical protein